MEYTIFGLCVCVHSRAFWCAFCLLVHALDDHTGELSKSIGKDDDVVISSVGRLLVVSDGAMDNLIISRYLFAEIYICVRGGSCGDDGRNRMSFCAAYI